MVIHDDIEQGSDAWLKIRAGLPTASEFGKLVTSKGEPSKSMGKYALLLAAEKYAGKPLNGWEGNQWTDRGHELESDARAAYQFISDKEVTEVGFVTDDKGLYGCSPDGFADDGLCEFKCLKTENHVEALLYYRKHGKCPTKYVPQAQGQMFVCEKSWNDVCFFHPDLPLLVIRVVPDPKVIVTLKDQLELVCEERDRILSIIGEF